MKTNGCDSFSLLSSIKAIFSTRDFGREIARENKREIVKNKERKVNMVKKGVKNEIIDFEKKGNLIRFYLGKNGKQWGDGWDDAPYEHNAGKVYDEHIKGYCDVIVDFDSQANELYESLEVTNTKYCKDDMKKRDIFCMRIISLIGFKTYTIKFGDPILDILKLECCHLVKLIYK